MAGRLGSLYQLQRVGPICEDGLGSSETTEFRSKTTIGRMRKATIHPSKPAELPSHREDESRRQRQSESYHRVQRLGVAPDRIEERPRVVSIRGGEKLPLSAG